MVITARKIETRTKDAAIVARWMKRRKITVRELAFRVSTDRDRWSRSTIGNIRSGAQRTVNDDLAVKIADVLDVPWEELFVERSSNVQREVARPA